ncbi:MAG: ABC transporter permease subunit [Kofleriaceae bacterium]
MTAPTPTPAPTRGVIHDLGYARYAGERRQPSTLWRVIARNQLAYTWKTWWRWKPAILGALITTVTVGALLYFSRDKMFDALRSNGAAARLIDGLIPLSFKFFRMAAFIVTMTVASTSIAQDRSTGAFTFYFSRPVRPIDYVIGKLVAMTAVMASLLMAGPVVLTLFRIGLADTPTEALHLLPLVGNAILVGAVASLIYAAAPMAMSALIGQRWPALGAWAGYWMFGIAMVAFGAYAAWPPLIVIDPGVAIEVLAIKLWHLDMTGPGAEAGLGAALISLTLHLTVAVGLIYASVRRHALASVGASS